MPGSILRELISKRILIIDGAMGTQLQRLNLTAKDYGGSRHEGCNEHLSLTRPEAVSRIHEDYLEAGADIIETNTFGATRVVLAEYGLEHKAMEINLAAARLARAAADKHSSPEKPRFVAGSIGPTTKALSVTGGMAFDALKADYLQQSIGLIEGGADLLLIETAHDLMNIKAAIEAAFEAAGLVSADIPVIVSASIGSGGALLSGQDAQAFYVSLAHYPLFATGFNCAAGPDEMGDKLRTLSALSKLPVFCMPNAGMPDENGKYRLSPEAFADKTAAFAANGWVNIVGGCCGTGPEHISALAGKVRGHSPRKAAARGRWAVCGTEAVFFDEIEAPLLAGERANSIGSKIFRELVAAGKWDEAVDTARRQARGGAQVLDVCLSNPERDELADAREFIPRLLKAVRTPVMIDTTSLPVADCAMRLCPGKGIWNSVNLEHGKEKLLHAAELNKRHGTKLVVGCIDDNKDDGMALTRARKLDIARRSHKILVSEGGMDPSDIIFDALVFPAASSQGKYAGSAAETIEAIKLLKREFPECKTLLGVSNVSFGLPPAAREVLNAVFLHHCVKAGLDIAIVNVEKLKRYAALGGQERSLGEKLLFSSDAQAAAAFSDLFRKDRPKSAPAQNLPPDERLYRAVLEGGGDSAGAALELLKTIPPMEIINGPLSKAMSEVGRLFAKGELIVTEVLQSAETMSRAVSALEPHMKGSGAASRGKVLLATVKGDVHDIGKNLVHIILRSNGFEVVDLGVKVPNETIVAEARRIKPDVIALSGLLTRSAEAMVAVASDLSAAGIRVPVIVGGAALTAKFASGKIAPKHSAPVYYAQDAMKALEIAAALSGPAKRAGLAAK